MSVGRLVEKPIGWFKPDPGNVKLHSEQQIEHLMASIKRFGWRDPIGTDEQGNVIEGHGRLEAAKRLMMKRVPALILTGLTDRQKKAYAIAHNQTTLNSGLDQTAVREEFERLEVGENDYVSLGYTPEDALFLLDRETGSGTQDRGERSGRPPEVIFTTLHFASKQSFEQFTSFLSVLRLRYPDRQSIAERLDAFTQEYGGNL
jgi:ParB family chromosome partitioning protein